MMKNCGGASRCWTSPVAVGRLLFPRHDAPMHQISWVGKRYPRVTARAWLIVWIWVDYTPTLSVGSSSISPGYPICDFK